MPTTEININGYITVDHEVNSDSCIMFLYHEELSMPNWWESYQMLNGAVFECVDGWVGQGFQYTTIEHMRKLINDLERKTH